MKALRIYQDAVVRVEDVELPQIGVDEVLVKVAACGICGSDIPRVLKNKAHYYPITLGHEFAGTIVALGTEVRGFSAGEHVACAPLLPCFHCPDCEKGNYSLCKHYKFIGSSLSGAMAEYVAVPARNLVKLPDTLDLQTAAIIEPLTVALHALKQNSHQPGKNVAVLGMGTIGCLLAQTVLHQGAANVTAVVRNEKYDELLKKIGVASVLNTSVQGWEERALELTGRQGFDFVYETAGATQTMIQAFQIAANKAHICFVGTPKDDITFTVKQWELMNRKEFYLTGSWMSYSQDFPGSEWTGAVKLLSTGSVKVYPEMIHRTVKLTDSAAIFDDYKQSGTIAGRNFIVME